WDVWCAPSHGSLWSWFAYEPYHGGMYGVPPLMDGYGLGLPMSPTMGLRPGFFPEDKSQKKAGGE
ncbi:UNVERIFIED_CONTAM: hypothetical protein Slati_3180000, partial [Sesamum latifolium]